MNQQLIKMLKAGIFAGALAAVIEIVISAVMTKYLAADIGNLQLAAGGLTIGLATFALTLIISIAVGRSKQKI